MSSHAPWWGEFSFDIAQVRRWSLGSKAIYIQRKQLQWLTWHCEEENQVEAKQPIVVESVNEQTTPNESNLVRHLQDNINNNIKVRPALADRSVVARPSVPLNLLAGEKITIYVSTPLWIVASTQPDDSVMIDIPFYRPSDSWFGPSTIKGELCYAKYTDARLDINLLERHGHRAVTPIRINNLSKESMAIERVNVPIPYLHLYADKNNDLWTNIITLTREDDGDMAEVVLDKEAPESVEEAVMVAQPRTSSAGNRFIRNISNLLA